MVMSNLMLPDWLSDIKCLPVLPHDIHGLVNVLSDDTLDFKQVAKVLEAHQSIASRLLMLANSAWANSGEAVTSIERACFKLGLNIVRGVSIGLAVMKPFNVNSCPAFDLGRYWVSSMLVADGASTLANQMPVAKQDPHYVKTVHTAGILHNIGLLCLADLKPRETHKVLMAKQSDSEVDLIEGFRSEIGIDYCEAGGLLAASWELPAELVTCIRYHRSLAYDGPFRQEAMLVGIAANWVCVLSRQAPMAHSDWLEQQGVDVTQQQIAFNKLQEQFHKTAELAATLFLQS